MNVGTEHSLFAGIRDLLIAILRCLEQCFDREAADVIVCRALQTYGGEAEYNETLRGVKAC